MYAEDRTTIVDRREALRVKVKSLAVEARLIRHEEHKTHGVLREHLHRHRVIQVRDAARNTHLAYGLIRGRAYEQMEPKAFLPPNWKEVRRMIETYGPTGFELPVVARAK